MLRNKLLAIRPKEFTLEVNVDGTMETILIRRMTAGQRNAALGDVSGDGKVGPGRMNRMQALAVVQCALDPANQQPMFTEADIDVLLALPSGSWFDKVSEAVLSASDEDAAAAKK